MTTTVPPTSAGAARDLTERGYRVVPVPAREKGPRLREWQKLRLTPEDLPRYFTGAENVGLLLGEPSGGLVDVDLDAPEAVAVAQAFLPETAMIHGRPAKPRSHWWYVCDQAPGKTMRLRTPDGTTLVELRTTGGQTIVPPSIHPSGEVLSWEDSLGEPARANASDLRSAVARVAAAALLARCWPSTGSREEFALAVAGFLLRGGMSVEDAALVVDQAARAASDEEHARRAEAVRDTARKLEAGEPATGTPTLSRLVGERGDEVVAALREWLGLGSASDASGSSRGGSSVATRLVELAQRDAELFRDLDDRAHVTFPVNGHSETWPVRSTAFRGFLAKKYHETYRAVPPSQALTGAVDTLDGKARFDAPSRPVFLRVGSANGKLYLDLADDEWRAVEIDSEGWRVVSDVPVAFRRPRGGSLPVPARGGSLEELWRFVNVKGEESRRLVLGWLVSAFRDRGPYFVLHLYGEQGTAKTFASRRLLDLVDPRVAGLRSAPKKEDDLMVAARHGWVIALDNMSSVPEWLSDALCRLSTGGGLGKRKNYEDDEEVVLDSTRPILLNGIPEVVVRPDLADRALVVRLDPLDAPTPRRTERELLAEFEEARPRILGALLDAVAGALARVGEVRVPDLPRMADAAQWITAAEPALRWPDGAFLSAYAVSRASATRAVLDDDPLVDVVEKLLDARGGTWTGTCKELLDALRAQAGDETRRSRSWPPNAKALSDHLRRLAPALRAVGIEVRPADDEHREGHSRRRVWGLSRAAGARSVAAGAGADSGGPAAPEAPRRT